MARHEMTGTGKASGAKRHQGSRKQPSDATAETSKKHTAAATGPYNKELEFGEVAGADVALADVSSADVAGVEVSGAAMGKKRRADDIDDIFALARQRKAEGGSEGGKQQQARKAQSDKPSMGKGVLSGSEAVTPDAGTVLNGGAERAKKKAGGSRRAEEAEGATGRGKRGGSLGTGSQRRTAEGYRVYRAEELGWNKANAGGTPLCPFDCDCCF